MRPVHVKRRLQFRAGPQTQVFYACAEHNQMLVDGTTCSFIAIPGVLAKKTTLAERLDETLGCDFCREG